jgi:hypothetical protein
VAGISPERVDALLGRPLPSRLPRALILTSLVVLILLVVVVWRASRAAAADVTFNLPVVSAQPCMLVLALVPLLVCAGAVFLRRRPSGVSRART